jgi:hypothetical protein
VQNEAVQREEDLATPGEYAGQKASLPDEEECGAREDVPTRSA